jgi:hypothetical protein
LPIASRICLIQRIIAGICINSLPRHDFVVPASVFPRQFSGLKSERG